MTSIPSQLERTLSCISTDSKSVALILRHADREYIPEGESGSEVSLTELGCIRAKHLGKLLSHWKRMWIRTSPLLRCIQTVKQIINGMNQSNIEIVYSSYLGEPGPFVVDRNIARVTFNNLGAEYIIKGLMKGETFNGIRSMDVGSKVLLEEINNWLINNRGLGICISHDAILMPFIYYTCNEEFNDSWLSPLNGMAILLKEDNQLECIWDGSKHMVEI